MAIALVQHPFISAPGPGGQTSLTLTLTQATTVGNGVFVGIGASPSANTVTSVTDSAGNTYSQVTGCYSTFGPGGGITDIWFCFPIVSASTTVTANFSIATNAGAASCAIGVIEYSGVAASPIEVAGQLSNAAPAGTANPGPSLTIANSGDVLVAFNNPANLINSVNAPWVAENALAAAFAQADYLPGATGTYNVTFNSNAAGAGYASSAIAVKPQGASVGASTTRTILTGAGF
jgi:hypothetical protein